MSDADFQMRLSVGLTNRECQCRETLIWIECQCRMKNGLVSGVGKISFMGADNQSFNWKSFSNRSLFFVGE